MEARSWQTVTNPCYIIIYTVNKTRWQYFKTNIALYGDVFEDGVAGDIGKYLTLRLAL
jgi:hypothetical protein